MGFFRRKQRQLTVIAVLALLVTLLPIPVTAQSTTGSVSATVTATFVSVVVTQTNTDTLAYGTLPLGVTGQQPIAQTGNSNSQSAFFVTNNGGVNTDWSVVGQNSADWSIGASAGSNTYGHFFNIAANPDGSVLTSTPLSISQSLANNQAPDDVVYVWLSLDMPTSSSTSSEQSLPIVVTAVES